MEVRASRLHDAVEAIEVFVKDAGACPKIATAGKMFSLEVNSEKMLLYEILYNVIPFMIGPERVKDLPKVFRSLHNNKEVIYNAEDRDYV